MQISVALATYNGARYLDEQLASIEAQTHLPAEIVVSDDGSTDTTLEIVRAFAARAGFSVRILENRERLGFADNFLRAAETCSFPLIAFCDQDDVWLPDKLERALKRLTVDDSLLAMHRLTVVDEDLQQYGCWDQDISGNRVLEPLELDPYITGWGNSMLFRRDLVHLVPRENRPAQPQSLNKPLTHDTWIYVLAAALGRVSQIHSPLILYRQHDRNAAGINLRQGGIRHRLANWCNVPFFMFQEQFLFYERMVVVFTGLSADVDGPMAARALTARDRFVDRRNLLEVRLTVFAGKSICCRFRAFLKLQRMPRDTPPWLGAQAKELVLGVAGVHLLRHPASRIM